MPLAQAQSNSLQSSASGPSTMHSLSHRNTLAREALTNDHTLTLVLMTPLGRFMRLHILCLNHPHWRTCTDKGWLRFKALHDLRLQGFMLVEAWSGPHPAMCGSWKANELHVLEWERADGRLGYIPFWPQPCWGADPYTAPGTIASVASWIWHDAQPFMLLGSDGYGIAGVWSDEALNAIASSDCVDGTLQWDPKSQEQNVAHNEVRRPWLLSQLAWKGEYSPREQPTWPASTSPST